MSEKKELLTTRWGMILSAIGFIITMVVVAGTVWGGSATILVLALRKERRKKAGKTDG